MVMGNFVERSVGSVGFGIGAVGCDVVCVGVAVRLYLGAQGSMRESR